MECKRFTQAVTTKVRKVSSMMKNGGKRIGSGRGREARHRCSRAFGLAACATVVWIAGCGGAEDSAGSEAAPEKAPPKEVTLTVFSTLSDEEVRQFWIEPAKAKFPHITVQHRKSAQGATIKDLVASREVPDLVRVAATNIQSEYLDLGIALDHRPLIEKTKYNLGQFEPLYMRQLSNNAGAEKGEVYGLPINRISPYVLYYNKTLFDKFGVAYPADGMTWNDAYSLTQKLARTDGGVVYQGMAMVFTEFLRDNQLGVPALDPNADRMMDETRWKPLLETFLRFYQIPNNVIGRNSSAELNKFSKERTAAMLVAQTNSSESFPADLDWDMASLPVFPEHPKAGALPPPAYFAITQQSKHPEEAFELMTFWLSKEVQLEQAELGRVPSLVATGEVQDRFGSKSERLKDKNTAAVFYHQGSLEMPARKKELTVVQQGTTQSIMSQVLVDAATGVTDLNTGLRTAGEKVKAEIEKVKAANSR